MKEVSYMYNENYSTIKELKKTQANGKTYHVHISE